MKVSLISLVMCVCLFTGCSFEQGVVDSANRGGDQGSSALYTSVISNISNIRGNLPSNLSIVVLNGRVLIVGYVKSAEEHIQLMNAVWKTEGVKEVIDHLELESKSQKDGFSISYALLKAQIDAKVIASSQLKSKNFQYTLFKQNVYVLACPGSSLEKEAFFNLMKTTPTIEKVFFYDTRR